jgi:HAD superfamily hydrolase (TIGR01548 family)
MDGVLAEVSASYRAAIISTCDHFGVKVTPEDIVECKRQGGMNNDWVVCQFLLAKSAVTKDLDTISKVFDDLYDGGLYKTETLMVPRETIQRLAEKRPLAVVTGRPRAQAVRFLQDFDIAQFFSAVVCMEDAPSKPDPKPVLLAMARLGQGIERGVMIGDTPDDIKAAVAAGVKGIGVLVGKGELKQALIDAGAKRILTHASEIEQLIEHL